MEVYNRYEMHNWTEHEHHNKAGEAQKKNKIKKGGGGGEGIRSEE